MNDVNCDGSNDGAADMAVIVVDVDVALMAVMAVLQSGVIRVAITLIHVIDHRELFAFFNLFCN